jgi:hypothetical protein
MMCDEVQVDVPSWTPAMTPGLARAVLRVLRKASGAPSSRDARVIDHHAAKSEEPRCSVPT